MRQIGFWLLALSACSPSPVKKDLVEQAKQVCREQSRGVDGNTMTAPYDDCIAKQANSATVEERQRICRLAVAGRITDGRCWIDAE